MIKRKPEKSLSVCMRMLETRLPFGKNFLTKFFDTFFVTGLFGFNRITGFNLFPKSGQIYPKIKGFYGVLNTKNCLVIKTP